MTRTIIALPIALALFGTTFEPASLQETLMVHFIDVGQGDCTLVQCPGDYVILVDCGSSGGGDADEVRQYLLDQLDSSNPRIDAVFITHPDRDHYNLLRTVLRGVNVGHIYMVADPSDHADANVDEWLENFDTSRRTVLDQSTFDPAGTPNASVPAGDADLYVLAANIPAVNSGNNFKTNARSIVLLITYGEFDVILTGDATFGTEDAMLSRYDPNWLDIDVLKIGHHGSSTTSTSDEWLKAVRPNFAVASASSGNGYGHPRRDVIKRLEEFTDEDIAHRMRWGRWVNKRARYSNRHRYEEAIYSTAASGTIVISSNGSWIEVSTER